MEIGSLVLCIDDTNINHKSLFPHPVKGKIYTISGFKSMPRGDGISLHEIDCLINVKYRTGGIVRMPPVFLIKRFVELQGPIEINVDEIIKKELVI
jgi:hypothetical protein